MNVQIGDVFGRLTVLGNGDAGDKPMVSVACSCGQRRDVRVANLLSGGTLSCGCYRVERVAEASTIHGHARDGERTPEYAAWRTMHSHCYAEGAYHYPYFGGRGIRVCDAWRESFETFLADVGPKPDDEHVFCLLDKTKDYAPGNAAWVTKRVAGRHRRVNKFYEVNGVEMCLEDWSIASGIGKSTLHYRLQKGLTMQEALDLGHGRQGVRLHA